jgi:hypothetical protein
MCKIKVSPCQCLTYQSIVKVFPTGHQQEVQSLLRAYLECRRRTVPVTGVKEEQVGTQLGMNDVQGEQMEHTQKSGVKQESVSADPSMKQLTVVEGVMMENAQHNDQSTHEQVAVIDVNYIQNQQSTRLSEFKEPPSPTEARALITRLAVLIDEWVQNCEEKVNLTNAAYSSVRCFVNILFA